MRVKIITHEKMNMIQKSDEIQLKKPFNLFLKLENGKQEENINL